MQRGGARTGRAQRVGGDREHHAGESGGRQPGEVGLAQPAGAGWPGAVGPGQVVTEDPGPDEGLDVEVDDLAGPAQGDGLRGGAAQLASPWLGGTSSTQV